MSNRTISISALSGDCWCNKPSIGTFDNTGADLYVGGTGSSGDEIKTWIPFVIPLPKNKPIISAYLQVVATGTDAFNPCDVYMGCEAADNPAAPVSQADLWARALTTSYNAFSIDAETAGETYYYDITSSVQEILNRAGWSPSNTLAVFVIDAVSGSARWRRWAALEHGSYTEPRLVLTFPYFVPRGGALI